jgi:hypothetical protein
MPRDPAADMSEAELLRCVIDLAELLKWRCAHFRPGMNRRGVWSTAMSGSQAAGFPDLVMTRDRLVMVECKSQVGRTTDAQKDWLAALSDAGIEVYVWRPESWLDGTIEAVLRRRS